MAGNTADDKMVNREYFLLLPEAEAEEKSKPQIRRLQICGLK